MTLAPDPVDYPAEVMPPSGFHGSLLAVVALEAFPGIATAVLVSSALLPGQLAGFAFVLLIPAVLPGFGWLVAREFAVGCLVTAGHAIVRPLLIVALGVAALGAYTDYGESDHPCADQVTFERYRDCQQPYRIAYGVLAAVAIGIPVASAALLVWRVRLDRS